jgi:hypothetical protein
MVGWGTKKVNPTKVDAFKLVEFSQLDELYLILISLSLDSVIPKTSRLCSSPLHLPPIPSPQSYPSGHSVGSVSVTFYSTHTHLCGFYVYPSSEMFNMLSLMGGSLSNGLLTLRSVSIPLITLKFGD